MNQENSGPSLGDVVSVAALVLGLITAWLYVTGWIYAYHYFDRFRIPLLMAELPREHVFVYGGLVVWKNLMVSIVLALALFGVIGACVRYRVRLQRFGVAAIIIATVLAIFILGRLGAVHAADKDFAFQQSNDFAAYPRVRFVLRDPVPPSKDLLADLAESDCGRLVLATSDQLFLIRPIAGATATDLDTFVVPREDLSSLRLKAHYSSCS